MKRFRPRAQGRGFRINKRTSTITLTVSDDKNYRSNTPKKVLKASAVTSKDAAPLTESTPAAKKAPAKKAAVKKAALVNSLKWFGKEIKSEDVIEEKFNVMLRHPKKEKGSAIIDTNKPPTLTVKIPKWSGVWKPEIYDEDGEPL